MCAECRSTLKEHLSCQARIISWQETAVNQLLPLTSYNRRSSGFTASPLCSRSHGREEYDSVVNCLLTVTFQLRAAASYFRAATGKRHALRLTAHLLLSSYPAFNSLPQCFLPIICVYILSVNFTSSARLLLDLKLVAIMKVWDALLWTIQGQRKKKSESY